MEARNKRRIKSGEAYSRLFPTAENSFSTVRKNANVTDTVAFIPQVVHQTLGHTAGIATILNGKSPYETCSNIWHFVYEHIAYRKDREGFEQIRSPARTWHDRNSGVDCDCYTVFISSILTNCDIPHILRITKYHRDYFQHIYPVVVLGKREIPIDCVTDSFDYEVPYSEKKDYPMDLQYLSGLDDIAENDLGKIKKGASSKKFTASKKMLIAQKGKSAGNAKKKKGLLKKVVNKLNKANPATVLLRNGILAAMKLNIKNIGARLRWSYLSEADAAAKGIDPTKFQRLVKVRQKLETIFYGAGGSEKNLKKAILGGKGNKDKAVHGLDGLNDYTPDSINVYTPLPQLLGTEVYSTENMEGFGGLGQLGEPVTLASIGAAMGVLAGIVAALKQIGDIFPKKSKGSEDFDEKKNEAAENNAPVPGTTTVPSAPESSSAVESFKTASPTSPEMQSSNEAAASFNPPAKVNISAEADDNLPATTVTDAQPAAHSASGTLPAKDDKEDGTTQGSFWEKNKSWLKPTVIGIGGISLIAIGFAAFKSKKKNGSSGSAKALSGIPHNAKHHKRKKNKKHTQKKHKHKRTAVALL
jgi:hypothetical protein